VVIVALASLSCVVSGITGCGSSGASATADDAGSVGDEASTTTRSSKPGTTTGSKDAGAAGEGGDSVAPPSGAHPTGAQPGHGKPTWLRASGGEILNSEGVAIRLYGVNRSGTEYACVNNFGIFEGPSDAASISAMKSWKVNAVRVPLNEDCWLGINGVQAQYSGAAYQAAITDYVHLLLTNGMYPIVDLHWNAPGTTLATGQQPMPDSDHSVDFWTQVATAFKGESDVVLELYNEPWPDNNQDTDAAWACWQNGGACPSVPYPVAGMQTLVTAVRATGAGNLVLLGGVQYSNALSQWLTHKPADPLNNLAAAWHVYASNTCNNETCWDATAGQVLQQVPVVTTEIGDDNCDGSFPDTLMTWLDGHGQNYLGWAWDVFGTSCANYSLISDYDGTPNGSYGAAFQSHLAAVTQ
jgi:endoglucanase